MGLLTDEQAAEAYARVSTGISCQALAPEYGVAANTLAGHVRRYALRHGLPTKHGYHASPIDGQGGEHADCSMKWPREKLEKAARMVAADVPRPEIARAIGRAWPTIYKALHRYGMMPPVSIGCPAGRGRHSKPRYRSDPWTRVAIRFEDADVPEAAGRWTRRPPTHVKTQSGIA